MNGRYYIILPCSVHVYIQSHRRMYTLNKMNQCDNHDFKKKKKLDSFIITRLSVRIGFSGVGGIDIHITHVGGNTETKKNACAR